MKYVIFLVVMMLVFLGTAVASEYTVLNGDNLTEISKLTGHTIDQLVAMNEISNPDLIFVGQKLLFYSKEELKSAQLWCEKRIEELPQMDLNRRFFITAVQDIVAGHIRHSINEPSGLHFSLVLAFAKAWTGLRLDSI